MLDFPPSPKDRPRARTEQFDHDLWADIRRFVAAQRWPVTADRAKQAGAVAVMRRRLGRAGITPAQIRDVWAWYAANYTPAPRGVRGPLPVVRNAREFDRHWDWVTDRRNGKPHRPDGPAAPVTSEVQEIVANLSMRGWPKGAESQLPAVVAASVANLRGFLKRLAAAPLPRGASRSDVEAVEFVVGLVVGYAEQWWAGVWKQVHNWDEWRGDLAPWVWRPDHKAFVATVVTALDRRNGSGGAALYQSLLSAATPKERT